MKTVILNAKKMGDKESAHEYLKYILEFPEYYGANLDALYDCLTEIAGLKLIILHADEAGDYFKKLAKVMEDACEVTYL